MSFRDLRLLFGRLCVKKGAALMQRLGARMLGLLDSSAAVKGTVAYLLNTPKASMNGRRPGGITNGYSPP